MILYHGTNLDIEEIRLEKCRPYKDFGRGFYLTELKKQAIKMANRVARIFGGKPVVNIYEIEDDFLDDPNLKVKQFGNKATEEWALFVMNNRNRDFRDFASEACNFDNKYDVVAGPIANDDMALLFRQYENRIISFDMLVAGMAYREMTSQYSFHTEKAVGLLKKAGVL